jgi:predicted nucleotidyltransferase
MLNRFRDVFESLKRHDVKYVVIGGVAAVLHGVPRATFDVDILIEATPENAKSLLMALEDCAFATAALTTSDDVLAHEITIFKDRVRLDVQTRTPGLSFKEAWIHKVERGVQGTPFWIASREHVIQSKLAAGRRIDLEDVQSLTNSPS